jgi:cytochrome c
MRRPATRPSGRRTCILVVAIGGALVLAACTQTAVMEPGLDEREVLVPGGDPVVGRGLLIAYNCMTCHTIPGIRGPETYVGPPLDEWAKREYIAGNLSNTPENLIAWIVNPQSIEPGTVMPTLGVTPEEARDMSAYLYLPDEEAERMVQPWQR